MDTVIEYIHEEFKGPTWIVDNSGIYVKLPNHEYAYETLMPKEIFIEAYNKYIRDNTYSDIDKEFIG